MNAFFCDRCGRAFPDEWKRMIISRNFKWKKTRGHERDLCPECVEDLRVFMHDSDAEEGDEE